jgi:hypothetical protein
MSFENGRWHGKRYYFGLHYDLHANEKDTELGTRCGLDELLPALKLLRPDFVQTDCKGHPGMTSWPTTVPDGTTSPGVVKDALLQWREATRQLKMPLHCHYSGIWDRAAAKKHPDWAVQPPPGTEPAKPSEKMCPRGPYLEKLLIPQLKELIDRYEVDGFWMDGELWAVEPCYCPRCLAAFRERSGLAEAPTSLEDPHWPEWQRFTLDGFKEYVASYVTAVHEHKEGVLVCSNWLQTFRNPGCPEDVPTDWISGDNSWIWGLDGSRCEARWLCNRGKPWDIMLWAFSCSHGMGQPNSPWTMKPVDMLAQEAAMLMATGGNVQVYENPSVRTGQLVPWRLQRLRELRRFIAKRRSLCQGTLGLPQVVVLHSEEHYYSQPSGMNLMHGYDVSPVRGAVFALSECHYGVDVMDEWALLQTLYAFPVVVVPEQVRLSEKMLSALKRYVRAGGLLFVTGAGMAERFGLSFLGVEKLSCEENVTYHLPLNKGRASVPLHSKSWALLQLSKKGRGIGKLGRTPLCDERLLDAPAAVFTRVGQGRVLYVPADLFRDFAHNRYPLTREFVQELMKRLYPDPVVSIQAPLAVDVTMRFKNNALQFHFINRSSGIPNQPNNGMVDEIPAIGPLKLSLHMGWKPEIVQWHFEDESSLSWQWTPEPGCQHDLARDCEHDHEHDAHRDCAEHDDDEPGTLTAEIDRVRIHGMLRVK